MGTEVAANRLAHSIAALFVGLYSLVQLSPVHLGQDRV